MRICSRCLYDESTPSIVFDDQGICNYCKMHDDLIRQYPAGEEGNRILSAIVEKIKKKGRKKKYDCVVGVSGGTDSSYLIYLMKEKFGLRPLAVHYNNTWNTSISSENLRKVLEKLKVDLYMYTVDSEEMDDLFRSFFYASVPEFDCPSDIALAAVLYKAAADNGVKYVIEGHSFRTEGVAPLGHSYMDAQYIMSIQKQFGTRKLVTFPNMKLWQQMNWTVLKRIRKIRPFWYMEYDKREVQEFLKKEFDWEYYGGHHLENKSAIFNMSYYAPKKFNLDQRKNAYSAAARTGQMAREEGLELMKEEPFIAPDLLDYFKKRLKFSDEEFDKIMNLPPKSYKDYKTYKKTFERMRPLFWVLYKLNLVPQSFYIKYTSKTEI